MASHAILPFEIRLKIYEEFLKRYFDAPGIYIVPSGTPLVDVLQTMPRGLRRLCATVTRRGYYRPETRLGRCNIDCWPNIVAEVKLPVPPVLQAEAGEARPRLLKWLAEHRGIKPDERAPTLRYHDRAYKNEHDFFYLQSPERVHTFSGFLVSKTRNGILCHVFACNIRRIALPASIRHMKYLPLFLKRLDALPDLKELAFAFV